MRVTANDAKNRFGVLCLQAERGPVVVEKAGEPDTVLLNHADCQRLLQPDSASPAARRRRFNAGHPDWLAAHNQQHEEQGLWNDDLRLW